MAREESSLSNREGKQKRKYTSWCRHLTLLVNECCIKKLPAESLMQYVSWMQTDGELVVACEQWSGVPLPSRDTDGSWH